MIQANWGLAGTLVEEALAMALWARRSFKTVRGPGRTQPGVWTSQPPRRPNE
jgi:hypothetical protein